MVNALNKSGRRRLLAPFKVEDGKHFRLDRCDPADTGGLEREPADAQNARLDAAREQLGELQDELFAQDRWAVLTIFQALDAAGKDSAIKHVMTGVNPQGCKVHSFKAPSSEELDHDYMWRCMSRLPARGEIGVFNRSYYEEVLVTRVHPELIDKQKLPPSLVDKKKLWDHRLHDIRAIERYLTNNGVVILKFFLNVSRDEQKRRFLQRLDNPEKNWKFSPDDVRERRFYKQYLRCYEHAIRETAREHAPWYVVPADHKWFTHLVVSYAIVDALSRLELTYPKLDARERRKLNAARRELGL